MQKIALVLAAAGALPLAACNPLNLSVQQQTSLSLEIQLAKQVGNDAVELWCGASGIVYVVANAETGNRANPSGTVTFLKNNAQAASLACPMYNSITGVTTATAPPAGSVISPTIGG